MPAQQPVFDFSTSFTPCQKHLNLHLYLSPLLRLGVSAAHALPLPCLRKVAPYYLLSHQPGQIPCLCSYMSINHIPSHALHHLPSLLFPEYPACSCKAFSRDASKRASLCPFRVLHHITLLCTPTPTLASPNKSSFAFLWFAIL